jgi:hypothetical protein
MPQMVNYLGSFNVSYRRSVLEEVDGFDESFERASAEDNDLSYRVLTAGYSLVFDPHNQVDHYHPERVWNYLRQQFWHGYWRVRLYAKQPDKVGGDNYAGMLDLLQPPLALLVALSWVVSWTGLPALLSAAVLSALLLAAQVPMVWAMVRSSGDPGCVGFAGVMGLRAVSRGLGMARAMGASACATARRFVASVGCKCSLVKFTGGGGTTDWEKT